MRADAGYLLKKIGEGSEACVLAAFAQEGQLCAMKGKTVDLTVAPKQKETPTEVRASPLVPATWR